VTAGPTGARGAEVDVLFEGYTGEHTASTVAFIRDGDVRIVWDPGMVPSKGVILEPLRRQGVEPEDVTDVILSHHHPDHTMNAGLFPAARIHDHWAWYRDDLWVDRDCHDFDVSPSVRLVRTPGHTAECLTVLAQAAGGTTALTHLWWFERGPDEDPYATDPEALHASRSRILEVADVIVPSHGPMFRPGDATPR
jgi:glyoxylase-like metal-dependent hydrolase (beta-lactamase superfamily II)